LQNNIADLVYGLERAWNAGNSTAFAGYFAEDGQLVNIHGMRLQGRANIAGLYDLLFRSAFRQSKLRCEFSGSRALCEDAMLVYVRGALHVPIGSVAGEHELISSLVLKRQEGKWWLASLHNSLIANGAETNYFAAA
jgi:uncharacterized protein (TIGR02246 family)